MTPVSKFTVVVLSALLFILPVLANQDTIQALRNCAKESTLPVSTLKKACEHTLPDADLPLYKCFTKCVQQQVGIMSQDGAINPEASAALVPEDERAKMTEIANKCTGGDTADLCEKAYNVDKCYHAANESMYKRNCNSLIETIKAPNNK